MMIQGHAVSCHKKNSVPWTLEPAPPSPYHLWHWSQDTRDQITGAISCSAREAGTYLSLWLTYRIVLQHGEEIPAGLSPSECFRSHKG